jgi:hypothetical protein
MAFFDDLSKKARGRRQRRQRKGEGARLNWQRSTWRLPAKQREIDKNYRTIGEWFVTEYQGEIPAPIKDLVDAVAASKAEDCRDGGQQAQEGRGRGGRSRLQPEEMPHLRRRVRQQVLPPVRRTHGIKPLLFGETPKTEGCRIAGR